MLSAAHCVTSTTHINYVDVTMSSRLHRACEAAAGVKEHAMGIRQCQEQDICFDIMTPLQSLLTIL